MLKRNLRNNEVRTQLFHDLETQSLKSLSVYIDKCASDTCALTCVYRGYAQGRLGGCFRLSISGHNGLFTSLHDWVCGRTLACELAITNERG